ncbi:MAG: DUF2169 domain-containing protein [Polyangiaceae bacterium]
MGYGPAIDNTTPFCVRASPTNDLQGRDVVSIVAKLTWALIVEPNECRLVVAREQAPVRSFPEPAFRGAQSSIRYPADLAVDKVGTDVLLLGTAQPPPDVTETTVRLSIHVEAGVTRLDKTVRVFGPRIYYKAMRSVVPGPPARLGPTPLLWELAYGGVTESRPGEPPRIFDKNPSGVGFTRDPERLIGSVAPALDGCFAPIPPHWEPRASRAGTFDEAWRLERAPLAPRDRDPRYTSVAPDDQWLRHPLVGGETASIHGVWQPPLPLASRSAAQPTTGESSPPIQFVVPQYAPRFEAVVLGATTSLPTHLDTLLIDTDKLVVETTYRTKAAIPRREFQLERIRVRGSFSAAKLRFDSRQHSAEQGDERRTNT